MYLDRSIYVERVSAPLVGERGYRAVRRPGVTVVAPNGEVPAVVKPTPVRESDVKPGMRRVNGEWYYSARWL